MANIDSAYKQLLQGVLGFGYTYEDPRRRGVFRTERQGAYLSAELTSFPAITLKRLFWKGVVTELLWFLSGSTNIKYLVDNGVHIWDKDAHNYSKKSGNEAGEVGRIYGAQWRDFGGVDQIQKVVDTLRSNPMSSEMIVSAWNPADLPNQALPPCHYGFQVVARPLEWSERIALLEELDVEAEIATMEVMDGLNIPKYGIYLNWNQRSVDTFLGLPFNIASYALLASILARMANMVPLGLTGNLNKVHLYDNSLKAASEIAEYDDTKYKDARLEMADNVMYDGTIDDFVATATIHDFQLRDYQSYPPSKVEMLSRDS